MFFRRRQVGLAQPAVFDPSAPANGIGASKGDDSPPAHGAADVGADVDAHAKADRCDQDDVVRLYQFALGRDPESQSTIDANLGRPVAELCAELLGSLEFELKVGNRLTSRLLPAGDLFDSPPHPSLRAWCAERLSLEPASRSKLRQAGGDADWVELYSVVLTDRLFDRAVSPALKPSRGSVFEALGALADLAGRSRYEGAIEEASPAELRGWALNASEPDKPLILHLYIDGRYRLAFEPDAYRRDLQDRFGGHGRYGYVLGLTGLIAGGPSAQVAAEVREATSGARLGSTTFWLDRSSPQAVSELRGLIVDIKDRLARLEAQLPQMSTPFRSSLDDYADYARLHYGPALRSSSGRPNAPVSEPVDVEVLIDGVGASLEHLAACLESTMKQTAVVAGVTLAHDDSLAEPLVDDLVRRASWQAGPDALRRMRVADQGEALRGVLAAPRASRLLCISGSAVLAGDAVEQLARFAARCPEAALAYADADQLSSDGDRHSPELKPAFDPDLWLQAPYLGPLALLNVEAIGRLSTTELSSGPTTLSELALLIDDAGERIEHLPRVLSTRLQPPLDLHSSWKAVVAARFARFDSPATVTAHADAFGAQVSGALTIRRPTAGVGVLSSIIIPTRDRPDLLGPCLDSLAAVSGRNQTEMEVIVVDNGSVEPAGLAELDRARAHGCRVIRIDEPFNWSLLNNVAADTAQGDLLVFLNDDTLAVTPDWLDALTEFAVREDVGAVGGRLLYQGGTVQHVGMVLREGAGFLVHEGVGALASDPGYLGRHALARQAMAVTGACLATRRSVFREAGGFDSVSFSVEGGDSDYCLRVRSAGLKVIYTPHATLHHLESMTRGFSSDGEKLRVAEAAHRQLSTTWRSRFPSDPFYNGHFDQRSRPFAHLRPPPELDDLAQRDGSEPRHPR